METTVMFNIILTISFVAVLGAINSLLSYFLDFCFWEHSIFGKWLPWLAAINLKIFEPKKWIELQLTKDIQGQDSRLIDAAQNMPFYKVLGGCVICMNVWLGFISFVCLHVGLELAWWYAFPYVLFSSYLLRVIAK